MGLIQNLVDQPQHHGRGMALPVLLRSDSNVGDPTRRSIDPRRCMADDTNVGLGDQMNPVILFDLVEEYAVRPCLASIFWSLAMSASCSRRSVRPFIEARIPGSKLIGQAWSAS